MYASPIVKLGCNHIFHHKCVQSKIVKKWVGPKMTFKHGECELCKSWMDVSNNNDLLVIMNEQTELYEKVKKMIAERMKFEGLDKDKRLSDPNDTYYKKPIEYGMDKIRYYMCFKCKRPYFAGLKDCREDEDGGRDHNPQDLICGGCGNLDGVAGINNCKKHGKDFIEYKCKFCCNIASWFCWGTTHFCENCHKRQCKGDYLTKYAKDKLPKCDGSSNCSLKVKHPPNGEEYALGCSVCRNESENMKGY